MSPLINGGHKDRRRINGRAIWLIASVAATTALAGLTGCDLGPKDNLDKGQQLFTQKCGSCHTLTGAGTNGDIGPNLDYAFKAASASCDDGEACTEVTRATARACARGCRLRARPRASASA